MCFACSNKSVSCIDFVDLFCTPQLFKSHDSSTGVPKTPARTFRPIRRELIILDATHL